MSLIHPATLADVLSYAAPAVSLFALTRRNSARRGDGLRATAMPANSTPLTIITSVPISQWVRGDLGITIATGVSQWNDQTVNARHFTQATGSAQPTYNATDATLNNQPTLSFDGVGQLLDSTWVRTAPATTASWISAIIKQSNWTAGHGIIADKTAVTLMARQIGASPAITQVSSTSVNSNTALAVGAWGRIEMLFTGSVSDYLKLIATNVSGGNAGNNAGTGTRLGAGGTFTQCSIAELVITAGAPNAGEITALDAYYTARYGAGLV